MADVGQEVAGQGQGQTAEWMDERRLGTLCQQKGQSPVSKPLVLGAHTRHYPDRTGCTVLGAGPITLWAQMRALPPLFSLVYVPILWRGFPDVILIHSCAPPTVLVLPN